jgi:hypothetical protein
LLLLVDREQKVMDLIEHPKSIVKKQHGRQESFLSALSTESEVHSYHAIQWHCVSHEGDGQAEDLLGTRGVFQHIMESTFFNFFNI